MIIRGIYHAHSRYSHDGHMSFAELRAAFVARGYDFVIMTEHAEDLTPESYRSFYESCVRESDTSFLFVPGLEVPYEGKVHVGCFPGAPSYDVVPLYEAGIRAMKAHGAIAIYHHPSKQRYFMDAQFREILDGIEIWNSRYEGWGAPSRRTMAFMEEYFPNALHFCGLDVHKVQQLTGPHLRLEVSSRTPEGIAAAIRTHKFALVGPLYTYRGYSAHHGMHLFWYYVVRSLYEIGRSVRNLMR
jgi:hypothetical protein